MKWWVKHEFDMLPPYHQYKPQKLLLSLETSALLKGYSYSHLDGISLQAASLKSAIWRENDKMLWWLFASRCIIHSTLSVYDVQNASEKNNNSICQGSNYGQWSHSYYYKKLETKYLPISIAYHFISHLNNIFFFFFDKYTS